MGSLDERLTVAEIEKTLEIFDSCFQARVYLLPVNVDYWASSRHWERNKFLGSGHRGSQGRENGKEIDEIRKRYPQEPRIRKLFHFRLCESGLR